MLFKPRKVTSTKPEDLPLDYTKMVEDVIQKNYKKFCTDKRVVIDGGIFMQEICLMIGFQNKNGIKQVNFLASTDFDPKLKNIMDKMYVIVDSLGSMITQYVDADGDIELPTEWTDFTLEGHKVFLKFDTANTKLEDEADKFLDPDE